MVVRNKRTGKPLRRSRKSKAAVQVATKAFVKKAIKGSQETKYNDSQRIEQTSTSVGIPYYQDDMMTIGSVGGSLTPQGTLLGNIVSPIGLSVKWCLHNNSTTIGLFYRVLVLTNKLGSSNTEYRNGTNIFDFDGENQSSTGTLYDMQRMINKERYIVHYDQVGKLGTSPADTASYAHGRLYIKMSGKTRYDNFQSGPVEPTTMNKVVLILTAEAGNDAALGVITECTTSCRWYYKDA